MWLLDPKVGAAVENARTANIITAEQRATYGAFHNDGLGIMSVAGSSAEISIIGVLTPTPDIFAMFFGGGNTTYPDIIAALAEADADASITEIILRIDSPGGNINGLFETLDAIKAVSTPVKAFVSGHALSAAFAIASQADTITALSPAAMFGSVGIIARFEIDESEVEVTSTNAPDKAPDVTTPAGRATVRVHLDALHDLFVERIATGRNVSAATVNAEFGRGGVVLARQAIEKGMIDSVTEPGSISKQTASAETQPEESEIEAMNIQELMMQHPDVYAAAVQIGTDAEFERVNAHLALGATSEAGMKIATKAIADGSKFGPIHSAQYQAAALNNADSQNRADDDADVTAVDGAATGAEGPEDTEDYVQDKVTAALSGGVMAEV